MIRPATPADGARISAVLCASVTQLCRDDHGDDPARLAQWLANKTPAAVAALLADPDTRVLVAEDVAAVGAFRLPDPAGCGQITLLYVDPEARGRGHSDALLAAMERALAEAGAMQARLTATGTARGFYLRRGWQETGAARVELGVTGYPMARRLR